MNTAVVITKTDPEVKKMAQEIAAEFGISLSSLINAFMKQVVRTRKIEFSLEEKPSAYLIQTIKQAEENYKKGRVSPIFKTGEESVKWLEQQGI